MVRSALTDADVTAIRTPTTGFHVAIIMDGNGRWAQQRGRPAPPDTSPALPP